MSKIPLMGYCQTARHRILIPAFPGSNPGSPIAHWKLNIDGWHDIIIILQMMGVNMKNKDLLKVRLRGGFSDRNNIKTENTDIQYKSLDDRTRIGIINVIDVFEKNLYAWSGTTDVQNFLIRLLRNVFCMEATTCKSYDVGKVFDLVKTTIREDDYDCVFTVIEYLNTDLRQLPYIRLSLSNFLNVLFEKEYVGYRFVGDIIVPITDENEIKAINESVQSPYDVVNGHMSKSIALLSDREKPDYENSIKESISAVEALCEIFTGIKGKEASLGKMLKKIEDDGAVIHSAMKSAFNILYGYTSDAKGIRHAGDIGGPSSTFEEAKFMLVSCSAFINYLIGITAK